MKKLIIRIVLIIEFFICCNSPSYSQINSIDTLQILVFNKNTISYQETDYEIHPIPIREINIKIVELKVISVSDTCIYFLDQTNGNKLNISKKKFNYTNHSYDFSNYLIDNKIVFGHDGFSSLEYVKNNFNNQINQITVIQDSLNIISNIINNSFPVFLHPRFTDNYGNCWIKAFRLNEYFQYLIIITGGGGGAASYTNFVFITKNGNFAIYKQDLYSKHIDYLINCSVSDYFMVRGKINTYNFVFK